MSLTIEAVAAYLGRPASDMLSDAPFKDWPFERSIDADLNPPRIDYVFPNNGLDLVCDQNDEAATIFIHADKDRHISEDIPDLPLSSTRQDVYEILGSPTKKGDGLIDPVLGNYGPWDRFSETDHTIHVEYHADADRIKKITLIRNDVVPA
jgi:hypothetical protein